MAGVSRHMNAPRLTGVWRDARGVIATEVAFLVPVVLVGVMMLFELVRIGLLIAIGSVALDKAVQSFRLDDLGAQSPDRMAQDLRDRMVEVGFGYLKADDLTVNVLHFDNLSQLGGLTLSEDEQTQNARSLPVWSVTVQLRQSFLTPLPEVLSLGGTFRYQYKHIYGTELRDE